MIWEYAMPETSLADHMTVGWVEVTVAPLAGEVIDMVGVDEFAFTIGVINKINDVDTIITTKATAGIFLKVIITHLIHPIRQWITDDWR